MIEYYITKEMGGTIYVHKITDKKIVTIGYDSVIDEYILSSDTKMDPMRLEALRRNASCTEGDYLTFERGIRMIIKNDT